jgi:hypothetical protein
LSLAKLIKVRSKLDVLSHDPADNEILACGVDGHVDAIVSGDKHLLDLKKYGNVLLLSPDKFIRSIR